MPGEQFDGFIELSRGVNATRNPMLLPESQCARAINVSFRGGKARTRPAWVALEGDRLPAGVFRGMARWSLERSDWLVLVIDASVYTFAIGTMVLTKHADFDTSYGNCFFTQADRFMVVQDGEGEPIVLKESGGTPSVLEPTEFEDEQYGITIRTPSIPPGTIGIFAHGRIHMVPKFVQNTSVSGKQYLESGDILLPDEPESVLRFTETSYLSEGGAHAMPLELGNIGGLGVLRNAHTGTGLGSVVAFARNGVCAFDFSISRTQWKDQVLSNVLFFGPGCRSPRSVLAVNDDLLYRGLDGIRALRYSVTQTAGSSGTLSNTPLSQEVTPFLENDTPWLPNVSSALWDNRFLCTCGGHIAMDGSFGGLISWDVGASYYNGVSAAGVYDGLWTGFQVNQITHALRDYEMEVFAISSTNKLYRLDLDAVLDPGDTPIKSRIETKSMMFGDVVTTKRLNYVDLWLSEVATTTEVTIYYRPHAYPLWKKLGDTRTVTIPPGGRAQPCTRLRFNIDFSAENCNPITQEPLYLGQGFQLAVEWTGRATIDRLRASVEPVGEQNPDPCDQEGAVIEPSPMAGQELPDYDYQFPETP